MRNPGGRREDILQAALACFLEKGVEGTTMAAIRERSGASTGSIYHLFPSKDAIAAALYLDVLHQYQAGALEELRRHATARGGVEALARYHLEWALAHPDETRFLVTARQVDSVAAAEGRIGEQNRDFFLEVRDWLKAHARAGAIEPMPFEVYAAVIIGPGQELVRQWLAGRMKTDLRAAIPLLAAAAWRAVERRPARSRK